MRKLLKLRSFALGIIIASLLSACGGTSSAPASQPTAAAVAPSSAPAATAEPTTAPTAEATQAPVANTGECQAGFRLFSHELQVGEPVCVPENPQRIIALDMSSVETVLLSGNVPVGTGSWLLSEMTVLLPQYADILADVTPLGYPAELETVASLKPDLILATEDAIDVELASKIAPVVVGSADIYTTWQNGTSLWSAAMGQDALYAEMLANYNTRVAELQAAIGNPAEIEVSVMSVTSTIMSLWLPNTPPGDILSAVGLSRPASQAVTGEAAMAMYDADQYIPITLESVDKIDADYIFFFTYASTDPETVKTENGALEALQAEPLWQTMQATQNGQAIVVPGYWWRSQTYFMANLVLDDLFKHIAKSEASTPILDIQ